MLDLFDSEGYDEDSTECGQEELEVVACVPKRYEIHEDSAFEELVLHCHIDLINYARKLTNYNNHRADDIVQTAIMKAWDAKDRFQCPENVDRAHAVRAWLYRIVSNTYFNEYEHERTCREAFDEHIYDLIDRNTSGSNDLREQVDSPLGDEVRAAISALHPDHRTVIELYYIEDLDYREIAIKLKIPTNTVATKLYRACKTLEKHLRVYALKTYNLKATKPAKSPKPNAGGVQTIMASDNFPALVAR